MKITKEKFTEIFENHFNKVDEELIAVLKGHLLIENGLNQIIDDFVFHKSKLIEAKLSFSQKVHIVRSISLDHFDNTMWTLVLAMNSLRNDFAHQLDSDKRVARIEKVKNLYIHETKGNDIETIWENGQIGGIAYTTSLILGFLISLHEEVLRFKDLINKIDRLINKHRQ